MREPEVRIVKKYNKRMPRFKLYLVQTVWFSFFGRKVWVTYSKEHLYSDAIHVAERYYNALKQDYDASQNRSPDEVIWKKP